MTCSFTGIITAAEEGGYVGYIAEVQGANTQGETVEEVRQNLAEAVALLLATNRDLALAEAAHGSTTVPIVVEH